MSVSSHYNGKAILREIEVVTTKKSDLKIVRYFLAAGFLVPCLIYPLILVGDVPIQGWWIWILLVFWPTLPLIMGAEAGGGAAIAFLISAVANVAVYGLVGVVASFCYRRYFLRENERLTVANADKDNRKQGNPLIR
jgi:hypothetical protein